MTLKITLNSVLGHYNVIGMAIGIAVGMAGKELIYSMSNDILFPLLYKLTHLSVFERYATINMDTFMSAIIVFAIVLGIILSFLTTILWPLVKKEITAKDKMYDKLFVKLDEVTENQREQARVYETRRELEVPLCRLRKGEKDYVQ